MVLARRVWRAAAGTARGVGFHGGERTYEREGFGDLRRNGEVNRASMWAIDPWLDLRASRVVGPAAIAEGRVVEGDHIASQPRPRGLGTTRGHYRDAGSRQRAFDHDCLPPYFGGDTWLTRRSDSAQASKASGSASSIEPLRTTISALTSKS